MHERKAMLRRWRTASSYCPEASARSKNSLRRGRGALLGVHQKPIGVLNVAGYWDGIVQLTSLMATEGFLRGHTEALVTVAETLAELLTRMERHVPPQVKQWVSLPTT